MPKASKFSPDEGLTIYDLKDNDAVHWNQSAGFIGKNIFTELCPGVTALGNNQEGFTRNTLSTAYSALGKVEQNTNYIVSKAILGDRFRIIGFVDYPLVGINYTNAHELYADSSQHETTINTGIYNYILLVCNANTIVSGDYNAMARLTTITDSTYEKGYKSNKELSEIEDISNSLNFITQTHYSIDEKQIKKYGNQILVRFMLQSLDIDSYPSGQSWTAIASGFPIPALGAFTGVLSPTSNGKPIEYDLNSYRQLSVRGGTPNCYYFVCFQYSF